MLRQLALAGYGVELALVLSWALLVYANRRAGLDPGGGLPLDLFGLCSASCGAVVARRLPGNPVGWLFLAAGLLFGLSAAGAAYALHGAVLDRGSLPAAVFAGWVASWSWVLGFALVLIFMGLVFPDGHVMSPRWRPVVWVVAAITLAATAAMAVDKASITIQRGIDRSGSPAGDFGFLGAAGSMLVLLCGLFSAVALVIKLRRASGEARQQLKWFTFGGAAAAVLALGAFLISALAPGNRVIGDISIFMSVLALCALPVGAGVGILKYRLYDIDLVISRTLVYGALAAFITTVYVAIVVGIGQLIGSGGQPNLVLSIIATAVVAVAFQPVRERLQKVANRLVYGKRATPYEVLSQFSERVAESYAADDVLPRMARVLAEGTGAAHADVWLRSGSVLRQAASWPDRSEPAEPSRIVGDSLPQMFGADRAVEVRHQGELLGALTVSKRKGESLTPVEEKLLDDLASQAGLVLKNVGLTAELLQRLEDLRASRQRLVAAQDEERRRLERNLHDGAQQNLVALKVKLGLAEAFAEKDPAKAKELVGQLKGDADEALETLRDLARGIYPPLLADKGLGPALESQARKATLPVEVEADGLDRYAQDIEAAVYFCCLEALQNVQKYARAGRATVHLRERDSQLTFEVEDDGNGFDLATTPRGSGLTNMADRLDALAGKVQVESSVGAGTRLRGSIPVQALVPS
jgi:signal transduction histidine kinase